MQFFSLLALSFLASAATASQAPSIKPSTPALLTLNFPPTSVWPNPQSLPARTYATLSTANLTLTAYLRRDSTFLFEDISPGSYLGEIWTGAAGVNTVPLRVDVVGSDEKISSSGNVAKQNKRISVWQTFRGNEWDNKGELLGQGTGKEGVRVDIQVLGKRDVYEQRTGFSPLSLFKNPMILIGIVGLGLMFGMPKLMENMDPELREEFQKQQRAGGGATGLANALTGQGSGGFDAASWLAGATSEERRPSPARSSGVEGSKGGRKRRG